MTTATQTRELWRPPAAGIPPTKTCIGGEFVDAVSGAREAVILRLADRIREDVEELTLLDSLDVGKPVRGAFKFDVTGAAGVSQLAGALLFRWAGTARR